jgi:hypothetical protein
MSLPWGHWQVENKRHWQLDFTFKEDQNTTMSKHGAQNLQTMKRVALAILSAGTVLLYGQKSETDTVYSLAGI